MRLKTVIAVCVVAILAIATSCQKISEPALGDLRVSQLGSTGEIPRELGELVGVTTAAAWDKGAQLWFVTPDGTISIVSMNLETRKLSGSVVTIPRR